MVVSDKMQSTVVVKRDRFVKVKKYNRYKKSSSKIPAHNPPCLNAKAGDLVRIIECRKLSKTKNFVVIEVLTGNTQETPAAPVKAVKKAVKARKKPLKKAKEVDNG